MKRCPSCNELNSDYADHCEKCGADLTPIKNTLKSDEKLYIEKRNRKPSVFGLIIGFVGTIYGFSGVFLWITSYFRPYGYSNELPIFSFVFIIMGIVLVKEYYNSLKLYTEYVELVKTIDKN